MPIQKLTFFGGLNTDSSFEALKPNESPYRINVRVMSSENGDEQAAETMNGNTLVSFTLPTGTNKVIGAKEYLIGKKIYYFVYNSSGNHSILEYDEVTNTVATVLQNSLLGFLSNKLITGINIIELDSTNHLLYWTDNNKEPRKINIEKGKYHTAGNFILGYPATFVEEFIYRIKQPMPQAPLVTYANDATRVINKLYGTLFQFKVQNVFDDKEVSSWSPISKTRYPDPTLTIGVDNTIILTFDTGSEIVKKIRIAVKMVNDPNFKLVVDIDKAQLGITNNTVWTYYFYNDGNYIPLETNESIKLFDNVPKLSQSHELIYGNRLVDGLITEGFDSVNVDLKLDLTIALEATGPSPVIKPINALRRGGSYPAIGVIYADHANRSGTTQANQGKFDVIQPNGSYGTELLVPFYTSPGGAPRISITYNTLTGGNFAISDYVLAASSTGFGYIMGITILTPTTGILIIGNLTGSWTGGVTVAQVAGPVYANYSTYSAVVNPIYGGSYPILNWTLFNEPPSWATHYWFARALNASNDRYLQFAANYFFYKDSFGAPATYNTASQMTIEIDVANQLITSEPGAIITYDYEKGDRIRFIRDQAGNLFNSYIDFAIASYDAVNGYIVVKYPNGYTPINFDPNIGLGGVIFEIYQPALTISLDERITYEIDCGNTVTYDSARGHYIHGGDINNQIISNFTSATYAIPPTLNLVLPVGHGLLSTDSVKIIGTGNVYSVYGVVSSVTPTSAIITTNTTLVGIFNAAVSGTISKGAKGLFAGGDTFYRGREITYRNAQTKGFFIEDANYSDLFVSPGYDYGRPNRIDPNYREITRLSTVYWSEQFIPETNINGLSTVYDTSFQTYEDKYGGIYKLYAEDQNLIVFQELKIGAALVQQIIIDSGNGNSLIGASENILSTKINYYIGEFGIGKHPESFAVYGMAKYGIDVLRGVIWRLSHNGLTPISDEGNISTFTRNQCSSVLGSSSKVEIYGVYDTRFEEYVVAFTGFGKAMTEVLPVTIAWNEEKNAWSTFYSYAPEMMVSNGIDIVTFKSGSLYTHNSNIIQGNFYGVQYKPSVWVVANALPSNKKVAKAISLESIASWNVTVESPDGQTTSLISNNFRDKEGFQYSEILRNDNTVNVVDPRFNGDPMRAATFLLKLQYQNTNFNKLFAVNILMVQSNRSGK